MLLTKDDIIIFFGDSVTDASRAKPKGEGVYWWDDDWGKGYVSLVNARLNVYYNQLHLRVINKGISGNRSIDLLNRLDEDVLAYSPNWVCILIGINDVWRHFDSNAKQGISVEQYEENLTKIIEKTLKITSNILLFTPYLVQNKHGSKMRDMMDEFGEVVKKLAKKYDLFLIDLQAIFDKKLEIMDSSNLANDRIHPTLGGHFLIADAFLGVVGATLNEED